MKTVEIKVLVSGAVHEVVQRPLHKGDVCYKGTWYTPVDGTIDFTEGHKAAEELKTARPYQMTGKRLQALTGLAALTMLGQQRRL